MDFCGSVHAPASRCGAPRVALGGATPGFIAATLEQRSLNAETFFRAAAFAGHTYSLPEQVKKLEALDVRSRTGVGRRTVHKWSESKASKGIMYPKDLSAGVELRDADRRPFSPKAG